MHMWRRRAFTFPINAANLSHGGIMKPTAGVRADVYAPKMLLKRIQLRVAAWAALIRAVTPPPPPNEGCRGKWCTFSDMETGPGMYGSLRSCRGWNTSTVFQRRRQNVQSSKTITQLFQKNSLQRSVACWDLSSLSYSTNLALFLRAFPHTHTNTHTG